MQSIPRYNFGETMHWKQEIVAPLGMDGGEGVAVASLHFPNRY
jgi:hypothetical protein